MRIKLFVSIAGLGLLGLGASGCSGSSDPVADGAGGGGGGPITVAPQATMSPEESDKIEKEAIKKQEAADRKARGR